LDSIIRTADTALAIFAVEHRDATAIAHGATGLLREIKWRSG
jgi:hypothetical protein